MLIRMSVLVCLAGTALLAGEQSPALQPPGLNQLSRDQFQKLFAKGFGQSDFFHLPKLSEPPKLFLTNKLTFPANPQKCSIPLLKMKIEHPERFSMRRMPMDSSHPDRMIAANPAPACKNWASGK